MRNGYRSGQEETKKGRDAENHAWVANAQRGDRLADQPNRLTVRRDASSSNMTPRLQTVVEKFPEVQRPEQIHALIDTLRAAYDLDHAIYYALSLGGDRAGEEYGAMTYSPDWHTHYEDAGYRFSDPVVKSMLGGSLAVDWCNLDWTDRAARRLRDESVDTGIGNNGYSVPLHGPQGQFAMFSISKQCGEETWAKLISEISQDMLLAAHHIHRHVLDICGAHTDFYSQSLSPREKDVISMISAGRRRAQIAHDLKISENTLRVYIDSARHKLGAVNTFHAVALAVKRGVVKI